MEEEIENLDKLKREIKSRLLKIAFTHYFHSKKPQRPYLTEDLIKNSLADFDKYLGFQKHEIKGIARYRTGITLSGKYTLVIVTEIEKEHLNIITAWKTNRKWQKAIQK